MRVIGFNPSDITWKFAAGGEGKLRCHDTQRANTPHPTSRVTVALGHTDQGRGRE